jgi:hypothetical protein
MFQGNIINNAAMGVNAVGANNLNILSHVLY